MQNMHMCVYVNILVLNNYVVWIVSCRCDQNTLKYNQTETMDGVKMMGQTLDIPRLKGKKNLLEDVNPKQTQLTEA